MLDSSYPGGSDSQLEKTNQFLIQGGTLAELNGMSEQALAATYAMAYSRYQFGRYESAAEAFRYLCFYDHWNPVYFLCLGACQQVLGFYDKAISTYLHSAMLEPANPAPLIYIGDCYLGQKNLEKAGLAFQEAVDIAQKTELNNSDIKHAERWLSIINADE